MTSRVPLTLGHRGLKLGGAIGDFAKTPQKPENCSFHYITLVPHKSLMHHVGQKVNYQTDINKT